MFEYYINNNVITIYMQIQQLHSGKNSTLLLKMVCT